MQIEIKKREITFSLNFDLQICKLRVVQKYFADKREEKIRLIKEIVTEEQDSQLNSPLPQVRKIFSSEKKKTPTDNTLHWLNIQM